jgi:hypothetical protein
MRAIETAETLDTGQIRLIGGAGVLPADRLSFVLIAGGSARIAGASLSLHPEKGRRPEASPAARISRTGEGDVWKQLGRSLWAESGSAPAIQFWEETPGREQVAISHDGYRRLPGRPIHRRRLCRAGTEWRVVDEITGRGRHRVELRFHLPRAVIAADSEGARAAFPDGWRLRLRVEGWHAPEASIEPGWRTIEGRREEPCPVLVYRWHTRLPFEVESVWEVGRAAATVRPAPLLESDRTCISLFGRRWPGEGERSPSRWPAASEAAATVGEQGSPREPSGRGGAR